MPRKRVQQHKAGRVNEHRVCMCVKPLSKDDEGTSIHSYTVLSFSLKHIARFLPLDFSICHFICFLCDGVILIPPILGAIKAQSPPPVAPPPDHGGLISNCFHLHFFTCGVLFFSPATCATGRKYQGMSPSMPSTPSNSQRITDGVLQVPELLLSSDEITQRPCSNTFPRPPRQESPAVAQVTPRLTKHPWSSLSPLCLTHCSSSDSWDYLPNKLLCSNSYLRGCFWSNQTEREAFHSHAVFTEATSVTQMHYLLYFYHKIYQSL